MDFNHNARSNNNNSNGEKQKFYLQNAISAFKRVELIIAQKKS